MIEGSPFLLGAAGATLVALLATYRPWRRLRLQCGYPFGRNPTSGRIDRCQLAPFHRGKHVRPWSAPHPIGYLHSVPERCGSGHTHDTLTEAVACMYGDTDAMAAGR
jgi:hypothetical protein